MDKEDKKVQEQIVSQWKMFAGTEAYKDWVQSMNEYCQMIQDDVDNMVENRPKAGGGIEKHPIDANKAMNLNQRKVGVRFAMQYPQLRIDA